MALVSEAIYYARHLRLPGFTIDTQERLRRAKVLVIGVGGLGCPAALYLAGAGVGTIGLCDFDVVSATNLHRQILFDASCLGELKVDAASRKLLAANPHIKIDKISKPAEGNFLKEVVRNYDVVIDGTDNFKAKYEIADACEAAGIPLVYGSIFQFEGQVSVFPGSADTKSQGISYRDLFPEAPPPSLTSNCGEAGVIGVLPGIIGTMQANEAIKMVAGFGECLIGKLFIFDSLCGAAQTLSIARRVSRESAGGSIADGGMEISRDELALLMDSSSPPWLIDVRSSSEHADNSIGGVNIPFSTLHEHVHSIPKGMNVVVYCKSGARSARAVLYLQRALTGVSVRSLQGGVDGWHCSVA